MRSCLPGLVKEILTLKYTPSLRSQTPSLQVIGTIRKLGPLLRTDLARETGYSRAAVTSLVNGLLKKNVVEELGVGESQGGRRPRLLNINNPGLILIGGGVSKGGPKFLSAIRQEVLRREHPSSTENLRIEFSGLGPDAGLTEAIWLALERVLLTGPATG